MKTVITKREGGRWIVGINIRSYDALTKMGITTAAKKKQRRILHEMREFESEQEALAYHDELYRKIHAV